MDTAVVEFNSLADAVWPAAQDHDLALAALASLVLIAVRRVVIGRVGFEFRRTGINKAVRGSDVIRFSVSANFAFLCVPRDGQLSIGKAEFLSAPEILEDSRPGYHACLLQAM